MDASEQEQMEAAIQASLKASQPPSSPQYIIDSDSEVDLIDDSDEVETFSDSDDVIMSNPNSPSKKSPVNSKQSKKTSPHRASPSSYSRFKVSADKSSKSQRKDIPSRTRKHLSTAATLSCNYSPQSLGSEEAGGGSSNGSSGSSNWLTSGAASMSTHTSSPIRVEVDSFDVPYSPLTCQSSSQSQSHLTQDSDLPSTSREKESEEKSSESDWKAFWGDTSGKSNLHLMYKIFKILYRPP